MAQILNANALINRAWQPKMLNQFIVSSDSNDFPTTAVKKFSAPSFTDEEVKLPHINSYVKIRGRREWKNISLEAYDPIAPSTTQNFMGWARDAFEGVTGRAGYHDFYKRDLTLQILDPVGAIISEWLVRGAFIVDMSPGEYSWESSQEAAVITVEVAFDDAVHNYG